MGESSPNGRKFQVSEILQFTQIYGDWTNRNGDLTLKKIVTYPSDYNDYLTMRQVSEILQFTPDLLGWTSSPQIVWLVKYYDCFARSSWI